MPTIVGVRLRFAGKVLYFDPAGCEPVEGDNVIVTTERGQEYGEVVLTGREVADEDVPAALKPVLRIATQDDRARAEAQRSRESVELERFRELVRKHGLDMKPIGVEHLFDESKIVFYFSAEERVDFRELVRELAAEMHARVDMRQVGVRDEARMVGGLGHCGQPLCCVRFGGDFQPVSIRMAKEQDLPLNPLKISGLCGRLMCCLRYEYEAYKEFKQRAPKCGTQVDFSDGTFGKISSMNVPREMMTIRQQGGPEVTVPLTALDCSAGRGCPCKLDVESVEQEQAAASMAQGTTPTLREAERVADTTTQEKTSSSRRKRRSSRGSGGAGAQRSEAPKNGEQPRKSDGQKKAGSSKKGGQSQGKKQDRPQKAQGTPAAGESTGTTSTRRRRRRRPRSDGGAAKTE
ncbi:MAG: stage 0 sporulation family protein [Coriobacteriia bacterium]|nr:stage 0 sporulation family protein [Coriobacteriia bacterium]